MNIEIRTFVNFSGPAIDLHDLIEAISNAVIDNGFGVDPDRDDLTALIVVRESDIGSYEDSNDFVKSVLNNSISIVIPVKEEVDEVWRSRLMESQQQE